MFIYSIDIFISNYKVRTIEFYLFCLNIYLHLIQSVVCNSLVLIFKYINIIIHEIYEYIHKSVTHLAHTGCWISLVHIYISCFRVAVKPRDNTTLPDLPIHNTERKTQVQLFVGWSLDVRVTGLLPDADDVLFNPKHTCRHTHTRVPHTHTLTFHYNEN